MLTFSELDGFDRGWVGHQLRIARDRSQGLSGIGAKASTGLFPFALSAPLIPLFQPIDLAALFAVAWSSIGRLAVVVAAVVGAAGRGAYDNELSRRALINEKVDFNWLSCDT